MDILLTVIHLTACLMLIIIVLLQKGKGADLSGAFGGGGSPTALGVRSATQVIHKLTIAAAVFFMITSYSLGMIQSGGEDFFSGVGQEAGQQEEGQAPLQNIRTDQEADSSGQDEEPQESESEPGLSPPPADEDESGGGDNNSQEPSEAGSEASSGGN